jgi:hypothetical protein
MQPLAVTPALPATQSEATPNDELVARIAALEEQVAVLNGAGHEQTAAGEV